MQLRKARLCLDCEELHDSEQCPICASEAFAFLTRWIPVDERRSRRRPPAPPPNQVQHDVSRYLKGGVMGLALLAAGRWLWQSTRPDGTESVRAGKNT
jgi:hypothetical protein